MQISIKMITFLITALWCIPTYASNWIITEYRDPANAELLTAATVTNGDGYSISIFRNADTKVRWVLSLPKSSFDQLATEGRVIAFRVDDGEARSIERQPTETTSASAFGKSIRSLLWHGEGSSPTRGNLREILDGKMLFVRFIQDGGKTIDTQFDIKSASPVIADALNISAIINPSVAIFEKERDEAIINATTICMSSPNPRDCAGILANCMGDTATLTAVKLKSCMSDKGYAFK